MAVLDDNQKKQCVKDLTYRLNAMLAWDLMSYIKNKFKNYNHKNRFDSVYDESQVLDPAVEISIVFGRQMLEFLRINLEKKTNKLTDLISRGKRTRQDDVVITTYNPATIHLPIHDQLTIENESHLACLIKVANKAGTHLTTDGTSDVEFESMKKARFIILELILKYVPEIDKTKIWWFNKDSFSNAILKRN